MSIIEDRIAAVVWGVTVSIVIAKALDLSERRFVNFVRHAWRISEECGARGQDGFSASPPVRRVDDPGDQPQPCLG